MDDANGNTGPTEQNNEQNPQNPAGEATPPSRETPQTNSGASQDQKEPTYEVKVDGKTMELTLEELKKGYSLTSAANKRMEEAAQVRKQAEQAMKVQEAVGRLINGDSTALDSLVEQYDVPQEVVDEAKRQWAELQSENEPAQGNQNPQNQGGNMSETSEMKEMKELLQELEAERLERARNDLFSQAEKAVDNDDILGTIEDEDKAVAKRQVKNEVQRRVGLTGQDFPEALQEVIQEQRSFWKRIGKKSSVNREETPGIGSASAGGGSSPQPKEPPKADVSTTDSGYVENFRQRFAHKLREKMKARSK
jgi:hypothetical protein